MSDSEEESVCYFGTPLDPYDEDAFPKKRPITVEEQVAKDAQGRRRFHGAFTGGFSAGFYNTVGSLEGWRPTEFKSSRSEKALNKQQRPEDYMDDEDIGEFGIAPQTVRATTDYATSKKRKKQPFSDGPIPGEPVLETLLQAGNETVGYFLMKNMNRKQKPKDTSGPKVYGCAMPKDLPEETIEVPQYHIHEVYQQFLSKPKTNSFGLGYVGLDKTHLNLFQPAKLTVHERNNKKLSISGQAFGVGAFEDDDDDIYVKDDMSRYDFELSAEASGKNKSVPTQKKDLVFEVFVLSKNSLIPVNNFPPPVIPSSFTGKHNVRRSRFEPVPEESQSLDRKNIDASIRAKYLGGENAQKQYTPSNQQHKQSTKINKTQKMEVAAKTLTEDTTIEKDPQPSASGLLFDRFVTAKLDDDPMNILEPVKRMETTHGTKEMHDAVKLKMFGPLTRITLTWQPCSFLCKKFNVPEPHLDVNAQKNKKRTKNLIFEYQKHSENDPLHNPGLSVQTTDPPLPDTTAISNNNPDEEIKSNTPSDCIQESSASLLDLALQSDKKEAEDKTSNETEKEKTTNDTIIDITERVDVSKNTDLFKAVFLSSSESESEDEAAEEDEEKKRKELLTANVISEPLVPKIKPLKEGILSNIDFSKFGPSKIEKVSEEQKKSEEDPNRECKDADGTYGPKLPTKAPGSNPVIVSHPVANSEKWVEKGFVEKQKKHKKKHKKEKVKDKEKHKKKHKHKSKR